MNENPNPYGNNDPNMNPNPGPGPNYVPNQNQDYTQFGGWLMVWYWGMVIGGVLVLLATVLPALFSIATLFVYGILYFIGTLISLASSVAAVLFQIRAVTQMKARNPQFFDTYLTGILISLAGGILSNLFTIRSAYGVGSFIGTTVGSIVGVAIGLCLSIMYFSKSVRVGVYFGCRPLHYSRYWGWIKLLPDFIISESMPNPGQFQQMGGNNTQQGYNPQQGGTPPPPQDAPPPPNP